MKTTSRQMIPAAKAIQGFVFDFAGACTGPASIALISAGSSGSVSLVA
jgi:hypothetical protein